MLRLPDIKARVERLDRLAEGLCREVELWRGGESPLPRINWRFGHPTLIGTVKSLDEIIEILAQ